MSGVWLSYVVKAQFSPAVTSFGMRLLSRCTTHVNRFLDNQNHNQYTKPVLLHNVLVVLEMFSLFPCLHIVLGFHGVFPTQWLLVHDSTCLSMYFSCLACEVHVTFAGHKTSQTGNHHCIRYWQSPDLHSHTGKCHFPTPQVVCYFQSSGMQVLTHLLTTSPYSCLDS